MFISVIICTRNRANSLRLTLESLLTSTHVETEDWELLIVDNGSNDHTHEVCLVLGNPVEGERDSGLKTNTIPL
jgi:glycosyltransferase involved in cell wall biosynthesis